MARLVVTVRGALPPEAIGAEDSPAAAAFLRSALACKQQAEALGGRLCAWSAQTFAFDFAREDLEEAVALATSAAGRQDGCAFGVGISEGSLQSVGEGGSLAELLWGRPLLVAVALARAARPGEVLLDPALSALAAEELVVVGRSRVRELGLRAPRLDPAEPLRRDLGVALDGLVAAPPFVPRPELADFAVPVGCLGVVRVAPGLGGTRLLAELAEQLQPSRALCVAPAGTSLEPLGALRRALLRSAALDGVPDLPEALARAHAAIAAGEGTDPWLAAELVDAWVGGASEARPGGRMRSEGGFGAIFVDDAGEVDGPTLDVLATALTLRGAFRMIAVVEPEVPLPAAWNAVPRVDGATLAPLEPDAARALVAGFAGGAADRKVARRWARLGRGSPLAIAEALAHGVQSGALVPREGTLRVRGVRTPRGAEGTAAAFLVRRLGFATPDERAALEGLAVLGGDASVALLEDVLRQGLGRVVRVGTVAPALRRALWIEEPQPAWIRLRSRTARDVLLHGLDAARTRLWHAAAAFVLESAGHRLLLADAAWHARQGGDEATAEKLAAEAALTAELAGMPAAAEQLRALFPGQTALLDEVTTGGTETNLAVTDLRPALTVLDEPSLPTDATLERLIADTLRRGTGSLPAASSPLHEADGRPLDTDVLAERAREALRHGDLPVLEQLLVELRRRGEHLELAERMAGFVALGRGAKAEALGRLRAATTAPLPPSQRARALLAYGVALAAAGRPESALLETLDALAIVRAHGDRHGEHACARFLARLSSAAGHRRAAQVWMHVAHTVADQG